MATTLSTPSIPISSASNPVQNRLSTLNLSNFSYNAPIVTFGGIPVNDKRVRISMMPLSPSIFYMDQTNKLLSPLVSTNGLLFPFQPKVDIQMSASYSSQKVSQSNFTFNTYENSEIKSISLICDFPARNVLEAQYVLAATTFLRSLTLMFTGNDTNSGTPNLAGSPPLVVRLSGMGFGGLDYLPIAVSDVVVSYPDNVDYITVPIYALNNELTRVPVSNSIAVTCVPMFSRLFASNFGAINFSKGVQRLSGQYSSNTNNNQLTSVPNSSTNLSGSPKF